MNAPSKINIAPLFKSCQFSILYTLAMGSTNAKFSRSNTVKLPSMNYYFKYMHRTGKIKLIFVVQYEQQQTKRGKLTFEFQHTLNLLNSEISPTSKPRFENNSMFLFDMIPNWDWPNCDQAMTFATFMRRVCCSKIFRVHTTMQK